MTSRRKYSSSQRDSALTALMAVPGKQTREAGERDAEQMSAAASLRAAETIARMRSRGTGQPLDENLLALATKARQLSEYFHSVASRLALSSATSHPRTRRLARDVEKTWRFFEFAIRNSKEHEAFVILDALDRCKSKDVNELARAAALDVANPRDRQLLEAWNRRPRWDGALVDALRPWHILGAGEAWRTSLARWRKRKP